MERPILPLAVALAAGIAAGWSLRFPETPLLAVLLLSLGLMLVPAARKHQGALFLLTVSAFVILGILNVNMYLHSPPESKHIIRMISKEKLTIEGVIKEDPVELSGDRSSVIVDAAAVIRGNDVLPASGLIMISLPPINYPLKYGDLIRFSTRLRTPQNFNNPGRFDYRKRLQGRRILVEGRINSVADILLIRENRGNAFRAGLEKFRSKLRKIIEENSQTPQREILLALLLGENKQIPPPVRDNFNRTGTSHILAISGLHVGMIASLSMLVIFMIMKIFPYFLLRFNVLKLSGIIAVVPVLIYAFIAGLGVSVVRATIMILVFLFSLLIRRERDLFNALALAALIILLINPCSLFEISFQLSFTAVAALIYAIPVFAGFVWQIQGKDGDGPMSRGKKIIKGMLLFVFVSLTATLGTLPLIAFYFNMIPILFLPANGIVLPLMGMVALPAGMLAILSATFSSALASLFIKAAAFFAGLSVAAVDFLASLPFSHLTTATPALSEIVAYYLFFAVVVNIAKSATGKASPDGGSISPMFPKYALCVLALFFVADVSYLLFRDRFRSGLEITAVDVGQGSAALLRLPGGINMLVDGGGGHAGGTFDVGKYVLAPYLRHERIRELDVIVLTHPHPDHFQGLFHILENFRVREIWTNGLAAGDDLYGNFLELVEKKGVVRRIMDETSPPVSVNGVTVRILNPAASFTGQNKSSGDFEETNNASLVLKIAYGKTGFLLTGDISRSAEKRLVETGADLKSDVLFVPHHGGRTSSSESFLEAAKPRLAILSCGKDNIFNLPHPEVVKRYETLPAKLFRTDINGAVTVSTDGHELSVKTFLERED